MRLFHKVLLLSLTVALVPLLAAGPWIAFDAASSLKAGALALQRSAAEGSAAVVGSYLDNLRAVLDVIQRSSGFDGGGADERRKALKGVLDNYPQFEEVRLLDGDGRSIAVLSRFREDADGVWDGWGQAQQDLASRGFHFGKVQAAGGYPSFNVVVPAGEGGRRLAARVNLLDLSERLRGLESAPGGVLYVLDPAGSLAAHSSGEDLFAAGFRPDPRAREAARHGGTFPGKDGEPRVAAAVPVAGSGWQVVFEQPADAALRVVHRARRRFGLCLGAAFFLAAFLAAVVGRRLSRPLEEMRSAVAAMEDGRFDVRIRETSSDEIGSVAEALRRAQTALARKVRQSTVGLMAQRIGHDMRQNLGAIRLRAETLKRRLPQGDAESEKGLAAIVREVERGADYIEDLLTFGRERPPRLTPWDLNLLVRDVLERVKPKPGVTLISALSDGLPPCPLDDGEARRALTNLVNNAQEALSGPGEIRVSTVRSNGHVEVSVSDTGPGIPADKRESVFEDFYSTKAAGTGLGLGIVKRVMERHGGAVRLASEPGKGTTIGLSFPVGAGR